MLRELVTYILAIDIAVHAPERPDQPELSCYLGIPEISGMPDLVAVPEMEGNLLVEVAMRIGDKAYAGHTAKIGR